MLKSVSMGREVSITVVNEIGVLADMSKILSDSKVNIEAVVGYAKENGKEAEITVLTNDNVEAIEALKKNNYTAIKENEVLVLELDNKPGALKTITARIATEGVDIKYIYGTTCGGASPAKIVMSTTDDAKAVELLKK